MGRYLRLYVHFCRFAFARTAQFRFDFLFRIIMDVCYYVAGYGFFKIIFNHSESLGGWTESEVLVFISGFFVIDALNMTFTSSGVWQFPYLVNRGELDYYLIRPVSSVFFLSFRDINFASLVNLGIAMALLGHSIAQLPDTPGIWDLLLYTLGMLIGFVILWLIQLCASIPVFWLHSIEGIRGLLYNSMVLAERPDGIYKGVLHRFLTILLPLALIASYPTRLLLEPEKGQVLFHMVLVLIGFSLVTAWFWRKGLAAYSSASS